MKQKTIIVDCSVIAKWFLPDEPSEQAFRIKQDFTNKLILLAEPLLIYYEVNNIIRSASLQLRVNKKEADEAYNAFLELNFVVYHSKQLLERALQKAISLDISSYDASYVALAEYLRIPLYTSDQKLLLKTKNNLIRDLKDYK